MSSRRGFLANIAGVGLSIPLINRVTPASAREINEYGKPSLKLKPSMSIELVGIYNQDKIKK